MKTFLLITIVFFLGCFTTKAQKKNYISFGSGITINNTHNQIADQLTADGIGDRVVFDPFWFLFYIPGKTVDYPETHVQRSRNNRFRFGRHITAHSGLEAGFGRSYSSHVQGADNAGSNVNYLNLRTNISTVYLAYMRHNRKRTAAIGIGPAISLVKIKHARMVFDESLRSTGYVLPGIMCASYWNFVDQKSWFMGFRNDLSITSPAKTEQVTVTNETDQSFVSVSRSAKVGSLINTLTLNAGLKF